MRPYQVRITGFETDAAAIRAVRNEVFIQEQGIPAELEWDDADASAQHVLALVEDEPVGTARLLADGRIGRMAVVRQWRGRGVGRALLTQLLELARQQGHHRVYLSAQQTVIGFYQQHGFVTQGEIYLEAGIPHQKMLRELV